MNPSWIYDDGGRKAAGFGGEAGDCVCRAIAIATGKPYRETHDELTTIGWRYTGIWRYSDEPGFDMPWREARRRLRAYIKDSLGWTWTPTMKIGSGCKVHLRAEELPDGRLIAQVTHHLVAVIDGVVHDLGDCSRGGTRCVYGYYRMA